MLLRQVYSLFRFDGGYLTLVGDLPLGQLTQRILLLGLQLVSQIDHERSVWESARLGVDS